MELDQYSVITSSDGTSFEFFSEGPRGVIKKVVLYQTIEPGLVNLMFGDWNDKRQKVDDNNRSDNGDRDKVLATVGLTILDFLMRYPDSSIFAMGSTPVRTRIYQMQIAHNLKQINELFVIYGISDNQPELFKVGKNYDAFLLTRK